MSGCHSSANDCFEHEIFLCILLSGALLNLYHMCYKLVKKIFWYFQNCLWQITFNFKIRILKCEYPDMPLRLIAQVACLLVKQCLYKPHHTSNWNESRLFNCVIPIQITSRITKKQLECSINDICILKIFFLICMGSQNFTHDRLSVWLSVSCDWLWRWWTSIHCHGGRTQHSHLLHGRTQYYTCIITRCTTF